MSRFVRPGIVKRWHNFAATYREVKAAPLCDAAAFTRSLEEAYRTMWKEKVGKIR